MTTHVVKEDFLINNFSNNDCLLCVHGKEREDGGRGGCWWGIQSPDGPDADLVLQSCQQGFHTCTNYMCSHLSQKFFKKLRKTNSLPIYHVFYMTKLKNKPKDPISISNFLNSLKQVSLHES